MTTTGRPLPGGGNTFDVSFSVLYALMPASRYTMFAFGRLIQSNCNLYLVQSRRSVRFGNCERHSVREIKTLKVPVSTPCTQSNLRVAQLPFNPRRGRFIRIL